MRIEEEPARISHSSFTVYKDCTQSEAQTVSETDIRRSLIRSDVVKNPKDKSGFRKPSPYVARSIEIDHGSFMYESAIGANPERCGTFFKNSRVAYGSYIVYNRLLAPGLRVGQLSNSVPYPMQQLINRSFIKLKDQKLNLGMTLLFTGQTASMIRESALRLRYAYLALKRGELRAAANALRVDGRLPLAKLYLELLFGWRQLFDDLKGAAYEMSERIERSKDMYVYGRAREEHSVRHAGTSQTSIAGLRYNLAYTGETRSVKKAVSICSVSLAQQVRLAQLGLTNPAELLWDAVRFSWIIDQVVSVGNYLSAMDATAGMTWRGGSSTDYVSQNLILSSSPHSRPGNTYVVHMDSPSSAVCTTTSRAVHGSDAFNVHVKNPFNTNIAIAAAAVLALATSLRSNGPIPRSYR